MQNRSSALFPGTTWDSCELITSYFNRFIWLGSGWHHSNVNPGKRPGFCLLFLHLWSLVLLGHWPILFSLQFNLSSLASKSYLKPHLALFALYSLPAHVLLWWHVCSSTPCANAAQKNKKLSGTSSCHLRKNPPRQTRQGEFGRAVLMPNVNCWALIC